MPPDPRSVFTLLLSRKERFCPDRFSGGQARGWTRRRTTNTSPSLEQISVVVWLDELQLGKENVVVAPDLPSDSRSFHPSIAI